MISQLHALVYLPRPGVPVNHPSVPFCTPAQWTPPPNTNGDQNSFGVAAARKLADIGGSIAAMITDQNYVDFGRMANSISGQADGYHVTWDGGSFDLPGIDADLAFGAASGPTGFAGDSSGVAAGYLWLPGPASIPLNSFVGQARHAKAAMAATHEWAVTNKPLAAYVIDFRHELGIRWWNGGAMNWLPRMASVLPTFASTGVHLWVATPPYTSTTNKNAIIEAFNTHLGSGWTLVAANATSSTAANAIELVSGLQVNQYRPLLAGGALDGKPACIDAGPDTMLVLNALDGLLP